MPTMSKPLNSNKHFRKLWSKMEEFSSTTDPRSIFKAERIARHLLGYLPHLPPFFAVRCYMCLSCGDDPEYLGYAQLAVKTVKWSIANLPGERTENQRIVEDLLLRGAEKGLLYAEKDMERFEEIQRAYRASGYSRNFNGGHLLHYGGRSDEDAADLLPDHNKDRVWLQR
ncbi:hypothetical protein E4T43_05791 [Aureobasidium subglaciale]|nr:hypothetical protein E4T43_05791 [Aureobasidium subglaciale]